MPIERILIRSMIGLGIIFLLLAVTFYPPHYSLIFGLLVMVLVTADLVLPQESAREQKRWKKIVSKALIGAIAIVVLICSVFAFLLWRMGPFGRLGAFK